MTLTLASFSRLPLLTMSREETLYLLVDGAFFPDIRRWLGKHGVNEFPLPVLADGQYDALALMGPLLIPLLEDTPMAELWQRGHEDLQTATVVRFNGSVQTLLQWLRARSQIQLSDGRVVWLRLGDATVIKRLLENTSDTPASFWSGIEGLSLATQDGFYHYQHDNADIPPEQSILADLIQPRFHFDQALVTALTHTTMNEHREVS